MNELIRAGNSKELLLPTDVEGFNSLARLALDMRWSWNHATDQVWRQLVQGVDVWFNTPRRPWEASSTSGMKVLVNDGINLSELDGDLDPEAVRVEIYADGIDGGAPERVALQRVRQLVGAKNGYAYRAEVSVARPAPDYTARLIPHHDGVAVPLEAAHILWQQ